MSTTPDPQDPAAPSTGGTDGPATSGSPSEKPGTATTPGPAGADAASEPPTDAVYYRPGPSSGYYPQYPQNPYGPGSEGRLPPQFSGLPYASGPSAPPEGVTYPYGGPFPAGTGPIATGPTAVPRPGSMVTSLVLLLVLAGFFLLMGLLFAFAPLTPDMIPRSPEMDQALAGSGLTVPQLLSAVHTFGAVLAVLAVVYAGLTVAAFTGRFGALIALAVLTGLFDLFWLVSLLSSGGNVLGAFFSLVVLAVSLAGVGMMFGRPARAWFAARR